MSAADEIEKLDQLRKQGVISHWEFTRRKRTLLKPPKGPFAISLEVIRIILVLGLILLLLDLHYR